MTASASIRPVEQDDATAIEKLTSEFKCVQWGVLPHLTAHVLDDRWRQPEFTRAFIHVFETNSSVRGYSDIYQLTPKLARCQGIASNVEVAASLIDWLCDKAASHEMTLQTSLSTKQKGRTLFPIIDDHPLCSLLKEKGFRPYSTTRVMRFLPESESIRASLPHSYRLVNYDESLLPSLMSTYYAAWPKDYYANEGHEAIVEIFRQADLNDLRLVCSDLGDVVGYVLVSRTSEQGVIDEVAVHPRHRRKGLGKGLTQWAIQDLGDRVITLVVMDENPARDLYEALGFVDWEERFDLVSAPP